MSEFFYRRDENRECPSDSRANEKQWNQVEGLIADKAECATHGYGNQHPSAVYPGGDMVSRVHNDKDCIDGAKLTVESAGLRHNLVENLRE